MHILDGFLNVPQSASIIVWLIKKDAICVFLPFESISPEELRFVVPLGFEPRTY